MLTTPETSVRDWKATLTRRRIKSAVAVGILGTLALLAADSCGVDFHVFATGIGKGLDLLLLFFPPEWQVFPSMLQAALVTVVLALAATILGTICSFFFALAASRNIAPGWLRLTVRALIAIERGLPEIITLLMFVAAFGVGAFPGILALTIGSIGMLAKLLADAIEEVDPHIIESIAATGATAWQVVRYAIIPQVLPSLLANSIFRFEVNVRASVLLGAVGAGGIGYELSASMAGLEYPRAAVALIVTLSLVFMSERVSDRLRARIFAGGRLR